VARRDDGVFQLWYTCGGWAPGGLRLAYAESADGLLWERPELGIVSHKERATNILRDERWGGAAVLHDPEDPRLEWRYKMLAAPEAFHTRISAFRSADGVHWTPAAENPVIGTNPDGPMGLLHLRDGRYAALHRPCWGDRRVARSESWDFVHWSEAKVVAEPEALDGTNVQFYGMGAIPYGPYELGTLWVFRTVAEDMIWTKPLGWLEPELVHSRGGYAWHRTAPGQPWIARSSEAGALGHGQIHTASAPLLLEDEIRWYFCGGRTRHGEDSGEEATKGANWGVFCARCRPDRFIGLEASGTATLLTRPFWVGGGRLWLNADVRGAVRAEMTDLAGVPLAGFEMGASRPVQGDSWLQPVKWQGGSDLGTLARREIRVRIEARDATLYALGAGAEGEARRYWEFDLPHFLPRALETRERPRQ
jgi:hypothetical protein